MSRGSRHTAALPLLAWAEEQRRRTHARRRLRRRAAAVAVVIVLMISVSVAPPAPRLVWNASASAPLGLYAVSPAASLRRGDMVIARIPRSVSALAASRRYIPSNVPLVKHVGGVAGDTICAAGMTIFVDGRSAAVRRAVDGAGRPMPSWSGCRQLRPREVFLLSPDAPASFDGRYFGVSDGRDVIGKARLLWAR